MIARGSAKEQEGMRGKLLKLDEYRGSAMESVEARENVLKHMKPREHLRMREETCGVPRKRYEARGNLSETVEAR